MNTPRPYQIPLWLALASLAGLAFALFGDGALDAASWLTLALPLATLFNSLLGRHAPVGR